MTRSFDTLKSGSVVVRLWAFLQQSGPKWAETAYTVSLAQQLFQGDLEQETTPPATESHDELSESVDMDVDESTTRPTDDPPSPTVKPTPQSSLHSTSFSYHILTAIRRFVTSSWLYRWLTAEPDAEVIVIDLRETLSAGPILAQIERTLRDAVAVLPTSGGLRGGFRLRDRFVQRPIRILSIGLIVLVLIVALWIMMSSTHVGLSTILLFGLLLVAVRGTQSVTSVDELVETSLYEQFTAGLALFEPPAPPEQAIDESSANGTSNSQYDAETTDQE